MKKYLLMTVAMMAATVGFAQQKSAKIDMQQKHVNEFVAAPLRPSFTKGMPKMAAPKKDVADGVWYKRPTGTYYISGSYYDDNNVLQSFKYITVPPFTDVEFVNMCSDDVKANCLWYLGTNDISQYVNEDGNLVFNFDKVTPGYVSYAPSLQAGRLSYDLAEAVVVMDSVPQVIHPFNYLDGHRYYGYSNGESAFMSGTDVFDWDGDGTDDEFVIGGFLQFFEKPITPMLVHDLVMWVTSADKKFNGSNLEAAFYKVERDEQGRASLGEEIKVIPCTSCQMENQPISATAAVYPGDIIFANEEADEFGTMTAKPFLIEDEFAVEIRGFENDDVRFYFTNQGEVANEIASATPTYIESYSMDGEFLGNLYYMNANAADPYCYNMVFMFDVEMDGINVEFGDQNIATEGGESNCEYEGDEVPAYVWTNYPMYETDSNNTYWSDNYDFEGVPEWAQVEIDPSYYEAETQSGLIRGLHMVWFTADALPEGVNQRSADIYPISLKTGIKSTTPIHLVQGEGGEPTGLMTVEFNKEGKVVKMYNMNGQQVDANQKGIIINNGKKMINK